MPGKNPALGVALAIVGCCCSAVGYTLQKVAHRRAHEAARVARDARASTSSSPPSPSSSSCPSSPSSPSAARDDAPLLPASTSTALRHRATEPSTAAAHDHASPPPPTTLLDDRPPALLPAHPASPSLHPRTTPVHPAGERAAIDEADHLSLLGRPVSHSPGRFAVRDRLKDLAAAGAAPPPPLLLGGDVFPGAGPASSPVPAPTPHHHHHSHHPSLTIAVPDPFSPQPQVPASSSSALPPPVPYYRFWHFSAGVFFLVVGAVFSVVVFGLAGQSELAPMGAVTLVANQILAARVLREPFSPLDVVATALMGGGTTLAILFGEKTTRDYMVDDLVELFVRPAALVGTAAAALVVGLAALYVAYLDRVARRSLLLEAASAASASSASSASSLPHPPSPTALVARLTPSQHRLDCVARAFVGGAVGGYTGVFTKSFVEVVGGAAVGGTWATDLARPEPYLFLLGVVLCVSTQLRYLNGGLARHDTARVVPVYQACLMFGSVYCGWVYFDELSVQTTVSLALFAVGVGITGGGILLLMRKAAPEAVGTLAAAEGASSSAPNSHPFAPSSSPGPSSSFAADDGDLGIELAALHRGAGGLGGTQSASSGSHTVGGAAALPSSPAHGAAATSAYASLHSRASVGSDGGGSASVHRAEGQAAAASNKAPQSRFGGLALGGAPGTLARLRGAAAAAAAGKGAV
jgi:hypothetical protein